MKKLIRLRNISMMSFLLINFIFMGCSSGSSKSSSGYADAMCDCIQDLGIENSEQLLALTTGNRRAQRDFERKAEKELPPCLVKIAEDINEDMKDLSKKDKVKFMKRLLKDVVETTCADMLLEAIPYDMMNLGIVLLKSELDLE